MKLSSWKKGSEIININKATPVDKNERKRHLLVLPNQGGKGSYFINPYKKHWISFSSLRVLRFIESTRNFDGEDRQFCETIFVKHSILDAWQGSKYASN